MHTGKRRNDLFSIALCKERKMNVARVFIMTETAKCTEAKSKRIAVFCAKAHSGHINQFYT